MNVPATSGLYRIVDRVTGEFYIGKSVNLGRRWVSHRMELRRGRHGNRGLQIAWDRDGSEHFQFEVIVRAPRAELRRLESRLIDAAAGADPLHCLNIQERPFGAPEPYPAPIIPNELLDGLRKWREGRQEIRPFNGD